jgi:hypothetical protein
VVGLAGAIAFFGYAVMYYGLDQIAGGNNGFFELVVPGKFKAAPKDGAAAASSSSSSGGAASTLEGVGLDVAPLLP